MLTSLTLVKVHCQQYSYYFTYGTFSLTAVHRIGVPLVWRFLWLDKEERVLIQFKFSIADKGKFMRSEYGPWLTQWLHGITLSQKFWKL
eukprot:4226396-Pleurochrysis_carterae.AAC.1